MRQPPIGPTSQYPTGHPVTRDDRGGIHVSLHVTSQRQIVMTFGTRLKWLAATPDEARGFVTYIRALVHRHWGTIPYDVTTLPIRVLVSERTGMIHSHLPKPAAMLVANPEVFLAWAQRLEEAVTRLEGHDDA